MSSSSAEPARLYTSSSRPARIHKALHSKEQHRLETEDNGSSAEGSQAGYCRWMLRAHRWGVEFMKLNKPRKDFR